MEIVSKDIEKLDRAEDRLEQNALKSSESFVDSKLRLKEQQKQLDELEKELDQQITVLSNQQDRLSDEQESLGLETHLNDVLKQITIDLKSLGAIKSDDKLSYKLSNRALIVNGKVMPGHVFELLKAKYIVDQDGESGFLYKWKSKL